jgi:hypothetical protein
MDGEQEFRSIFDLDSLPVKSPMKQESPGLADAI